jgi:RNA polymerase sigma factor (sigma-70 family)
VSTAALTDAELVRRCRAGDDAAWSALVERFARYVHAITTRVYRLREADAEDVFQEVFARTYEHLDRLRDDAAIRPWLGQLTRRLCVDRLRAGGREDLPGDGGPEPAATDAALERLDEALAVRAALATLDAPCQEVLDRFFARDESYRRIADDLDVAMGTVASRISRCLDRLRSAYEGRIRAPAASGGR